VWDRSIEPVARVAPGETVTLEVNDGSGGQIDSRSTAEALTTLDFSRVNPVTGPLEVLGAEPGDSLVIEIVGMEVESWGWTANIPGFGLLSDDFPNPVLRTAQVGSSTVTFLDAFAIPTRPMIGTIGLAPSASGPHPMIPPHRQGGNMDVRQIGPGCRIGLPVAVEGGLLSVGDTHAAQGDGEVCGTAVEATATVTLRVDLLKGHALATPWLQTAPGSQRRGPCLATTGIGPDLYLAAQDATRALVEEVVYRVGIAPIEAYMLASVAADLSIAEVVDRPNWVVLLQLPLSILTGKDRP